MKKIILSLAFYFSLITFILADLGSSDVFKLKYKGESYYITAEAYGDLNSKDLCYTDQEGKCIKTATEYIREQLNNYHDSIIFYKALVKLDLKKFKSVLNDPFLLIFKSEVKIKKEGFIHHFTLVDCFRGNSWGLRYTNEIEDVDNIWINDYPIELLFKFDDLAGGDMYFFAIKGNSTINEKNRIRNKLAALIKKRRLSIHLKIYFINLSKKYNHAWILWRMLNNHRRSYTELFKDNGSER